MSAAAIVRALLAASPSVTSIVPPTKVILGAVPQTTVLPAVSVRKISGSEFGTIGRSQPAKMISQRVQVTAMTKNDYPTLEKLIKACALKTAIPRSVIVGFTVISVLPWGEGPDLEPGDDGIYETSRDFMVTFVEAN